MTLDDNSVYVVDGSRSPFLKARGEPGPFSAAELALAAARPLLMRQPFPAERLDEVILGCVNPAADEANIARVVAPRLGAGVETPAWTVQRNCASGLQAIDSARESIASGRASLALAGGGRLDICLNVARELAGPLQLEIPAALEAMVAQGKLGKKSGEGFYVYRNGKKIKPSESAPPSPRLTQRLIGKLIDEAQRCLEEGIVASADEVDAGVIFGTGFAPFTGGPLRYRENNPR
ncbi:MAG TPA: hypothetical protein ENK26_12515 [Gammaproteobacteria bacterium]|nr:hypothetical protein [Gammaproteobacteria bacterium]